MATNSKVADDSSTPPSYDTISASPIQCDQSSIFSSCRLKEKHTAVLSRIRDIVLGPDFIPSSVVPNVNACAAALPAAEFSKILKERNIEGHTALYWVIVNNRPQALWALNKFIFIFSYYSSVCEDDLRTACMITSNQEIFIQLALGRSENRDFRRLLGCPLDQLQVHTCDEPANQFNVVLQIGMFQKRLHSTAISDTKLIYEFVAGGCIWWLRFHMPEPNNGIWHVKIGLCRSSHPARLNAVLVIEAHNRKSGSAAPPEALKILLSLADTKFVALTPWLYVEFGASVTPTGAPTGAPALPTPAPTLLDSQRSRTLPALRKTAVWTAVMPPLAL
ncbi:uncharacterized protein F5147DRAFT_780570 [Suillus discolor]|uniref:Uncharacterized protein n=1 Tax=Suillus discolor TaxID=1912936 RepID=A0A9P7JMN8_9AGAM|nr:uncharacterized protein F5147DRAFT_780570 [Suillus discolor]KAG2089617.1 hypothetical protein F5147DRAFT_780570 [Suillus discolor]